MSGTDLELYIYNSLDSLRHSVRLVLESAHFPDEKAEAQRG